MHWGCADATYSSMFSILDTAGTDLQLSASGTLYHQIPTCSHQTKGFLQFSFVNSADYSTNKPDQEKQEKNFTNSSR